MAQEAQTPPNGQSEADREVVTEAQERFKHCQAWESQSRLLFLDDVKFANGDSDNGYQWPNSIRKNRDVDERPCLTLNQIRQHNLQIINDAKQHKPGVAIRPVGNGATKEASDAWMGIIRHIEYISNATVAYDTATKFQVEGGIGYWRIVTDYANDDSFDQEIFIRRCNDPLAIYLDPNIKELDGSDATFAFVFEDIPREEFEKTYPQYKDYAPNTTLNAAAAGSDWVADDKVRIAEYWRVVEKPDKLVYYKGDSGPQTIRLSVLGKEIFDKLQSDDPTVRTRDVTRRAVEQFLIIGDSVAERTDWLGRYIPIVRVIGEETIIDNQLDRKGHTRAMKDPQRMYNYWSSSAVENVALQSKAPWIAPAKAVEAYEDQWKVANRVNQAFLPYDDWDEELAREIKPPFKPAPATIPQAFLSGMEVARNELMMVSGQYANQLGEQGNERTGKAIQERQRQGDRATYHFVDNLAVAIRFTGKILLDLIPHIYDTERAMHILAEDGTDLQLRIDPTLQAPFKQEVDEQGIVLERILNPRLGQYEVQADVGPAYATKREEAFNALIQIITQSPDLVHTIGDIMFKAADFPMADEAAERLHRLVPPLAKGLGPSPQEQALQQQLTQTQNALTEAMQQLATEKLKLRGKDQMRDIDAYKAETDRLKVVAPQGVPGAIGPDDLRPVVEDLVREAMLTHLTPIIQANAQGVQAQSASGPAGPTGDEATGPAQGEPPVPGAALAPDGKHYLPDPTRPGKFLQVV